MIGLPPSEAGAVQPRATERSPGTPVTAVGAPGTVGPLAGVNRGEGAESGPVPTALIAATVKVYAVPFVSPVTVKLVAAEPVKTGV